MSELENEKNNQIPQPEISEAELAKSDDAHVKSMNPLKSFALGIAMATGVALGTVESANAQRVVMNTQDKTVRVDFQDSDMDVMSEATVKNYAMSMNRIINAYKANNRTFSYNEACKQVRDIVAVARQSLRNNTRTHPQEKAMMLHLLKQLEGATIQQLNTIPRTRSYDASRRF